MHAENESLQNDKSINRELIAAPLRKTKRFSLFSSKWGSRSTSLLRVDTFVSHAFLPIFLLDCESFVGRLASLETSGCKFTEVQSGRTVTKVGLGRHTAVPVQALELHIKFCVQHQKLEVLNNRRKGSDHSGQCRVVVHKP